MKRLIFLSLAILTSTPFLFAQDSTEELQERIAELESLVSILQSKLGEVDLLNYILVALGGTVFLIIILVFNYSFRRKISKEINAIKRQLLCGYRESISELIPEEGDDRNQEVLKVVEYNRNLKNLSVEQHSYLPDDWVVQGLEFYYRDEPEQALVAFDRALGEGGDSVRLHFGRAVVLCELNRFEESAGSLRRAVEISPGIAEVHYQLGVVLEELGQDEEAVESFRKAVELKPDYPKAYKKLGLDLRKLKREEEAVQTYSRMGDTLVRLGREEEAIEAYSNMAVDLIKLVPEEDNQLTHSKIDLETLEREQEVLDSYYAMGSKFTELGRNEEALDAYEEILKIKPDDREACFCRCRVLARLGRYEESSDHLKNLLEKAPELAKAWYLYGNVLNKLGLDREAVEAFNIVANLKPEHADTYQKLASVHAEKGNNEEALVNLEKYLKLNPDEVNRKFKGFEALKRDPGYQNLVKKYNSGAQV